MQHAATQTSAFPIMTPASQRYVWVRHKIALIPKTTLAFGLGIGLAAAPVWADVQLEYLSQPNQDQGMERLSIKAGQLRMDMGNGDWILYRQGEAAISFINVDEKNYVVLNQATMDKMASTIEHAKAEMEAALAQLPPGQREQMRQMMQGAMGSLMGGPQSLSFSLRETGQKQQVNGIQCRQVEALRGNSHYADICLAQASELGISAQDAQVFTAWAEFTQGMMENLAEQTQGLIPFQAPSFAAFAQGLPVLNTNADGSRNELRSHHGTTLENDLFQIPSDYQHKTLDLDF